jgi:pimeloyl-ACP methyl ester carboxylesterase
MLTKPAKHDSFALVIFENKKQWGWKMKTANSHRAGYLFTLAVAASLAGQQAAIAEEVDGLRVTDYFVTHTSNEPFYAEQNLDPSVTLHVREVVLAGRERSVAQDGKVLLLIHGYSIPGYVAFDTDHENCSMMRYFARAGWDTFTLDLEGFGLSTRPPVMDDPSAFPDSKAPVRVDVTLRNIERVVDFISALRGVEQVHLLGWSLGATLEAPRYAIRHPDKVDRLVLFAASYDNSMTPEEREKAATEGHAEKVFYSLPAPERWAGLGTNAELIVPGCFETNQDALLGSDPKSGDLGGAVRIPAGRSVDEALAAPHLDAAKITMPTLVIRGDADTYAEREENRLLIDALGSTEKEYVEIPNGGHFLQFEKVNMQFYAAVQKFLEAEK